MPAERYIYALTGWSVEKREGGWYFSRSANRHSKGDWKDPQRQTRGRAARRQLAGSGLIGERLAEPSHGAAA